MRPLIICAAGALALAACQREEPADPVAAADAAVETATDAVAPASPGGSAGPAGSRSAASGAATPVPADASSDTMGAPPPSDAVVSGPSPEVRDGAKTKAEETNLHPRTH